MHVRRLAVDPRWPFVRQRQFEPRLDHVTTLFGSCAIGASVIVFSIVSELRLQTKLAFVSHQHGLHTLVGTFPSNLYSDDGL